MHKKILIAAAAFASLSVILGAFAAHALADVLNATQHKTFETAVRYQMYHALAMALCTVLYLHQPIKTFQTAAIFFGCGIILFSGSLYGLIFLNLFNIEGFKFIGAITPLGGLSFIIGWLLIIKTAIKW
jgi:uncharacterized membrane protein YgdD (TMEM256/DUF423 family)